MNRVTDLAAGFPAARAGLCAAEITIALARLGYDPGLAREAPARAREHGSFTLGQHDVQYEHGARTFQLETRQAGPHVLIVTASAASLPGLRENALTAGQLLYGADADLVIVCEGSVSARTSAGRTVFTMEITIWCRDYTQRQAP
jgi:hypothetical protein